MIKIAIKRTTESPAFRKLILNTLRKIPEYRLEILGVTVDREEHVSLINSWDHC